MTNTFTVSKSGTVGTPVARMTRPGWYTYQLVIAGDEDFDAGHHALRRARRDLPGANGSPKVTTAVSAQLTRPGDGDHRHRRRRGAWPTSARRCNAFLYGPFATRESIRCDTPPIWTGTIDAQGDGTYVTEPFTLTVRRLLHLPRDDRRERLRALHRDGLRRGRRDDDRRRRARHHDAGQRPADDARLDRSPTRRGSPASARSRRPSTSSCGGRTRRARRSPASARPYWTGTFPADGDGTYTTAPGHARPRRLLHLPRVDPATEAFDAVQTACGEAAETTVAIGAPVVTTVVSRDVVRAGHPDLRPHQGHRARQDPGRHRGRALRPVRDARGDALHRHARSGRAP